MAPSATITQTLAEAASPHQASHFGQYKSIGSYEYSKEKELGENGVTYPNYLPTWNPHQRYPPLEPFEHTEHGKDADPAYPELLARGVAIATEITPTIGTEVRGIQLSSLSPTGKDQLAHLVATRKVVAFRDQDFADLPIQSVLNYGTYFGRHHVHPTSGSPEGYPEIHIVHRGADDSSHQSFFDSHTSSVAWHSDVSYEAQPPGTTFLYVLDNPGESGGDTLFANAAEAYRRLSPVFRERLHGLKAVHSGIEQVNAAVARGSIKRREPVMSEHLVIRTHPVTGEKAIYVNPQFTRYIVGMKKEESDAILNFLYSHLALGADFHARVKWAPRTVVVWDNRVTLHTALLDWNTGQRRHLARITPQAERPYETSFQN